MDIEIERKYLVRDLYVVDGLPGVRMRQGYLSVDPERTVRVRTAGTRYVERFERKMDARVVMEG